MDEANEKQPWWNDGDKAGGAAATVVMFAAALAVGIILIGVAIKIFVWMV